LVDAESGQRGYIITGEEAYLAPYREGLAEVSEDFALVRSLTIDPAQLRLLDTSEPVIARRIEALEAGVTARRDQGVEAGREWIIGGAGRSEMLDVRRITNEIRDGGTTLLKERADQASASARNTTLTITLGTVGAFII